MLLTELPSGKSVYANAHVQKIYELDPPALIQARVQLAKALAGGTKARIDECERAVQTELDVIAAQVQPDQEPKPEQVKEEELVAKDARLFRQKTRSFSCCGNRRGASVLAKDEELKLLRAHRADTHAKLEQAQAAMSAKVCHMESIGLRLDLSHRAWHTEPRYFARHCRVWLVATTLTHRCTLAQDDLLMAKDGELAAKDEEIASVVAAMDEEVKQLRAQLERLEGVPPQRPDKDVQQRGQFDD